MADKTVRVIRTPHTKDRPFFVMNRKSAQDKRLSWEARGVLAYLLSKPDDWQLMVIDLQQNCGRDKVKKIITELAEFGYLKIEAHRDENGKFTNNEYKVIETPFTENPSTVNPSMDNPSTVNPLLHNTEKTNHENGQLGADKPRRINPIFELIALRSFGIADTTKLDKEGGIRIGKVTAWCKKHAVTVENLEAFYLWYGRSAGNASPPRDANKFAEWYVRFEETLKAHSSNIIAFDPDKWIVPDLEGVS